MFIINRALYQAPEISPEDSKEGLKEAISIYHGTEIVIFIFGVGVREGPDGRHARVRLCLHRNYA